VWKRGREWHRITGYRVGEGGGSARKLVPKPAEPPRRRRALRIGDMTLFPTSSPRRDRCPNLRNHLRPSPPRLPQPNQFSHRHRPLTDRCPYSAQEEGKRSRLGTVHSPTLGQVPYEPHEPPLQYREPVYWGVWLTSRRDLPTIVRRPTQPGR